MLIGQIFSNKGSGPHVNANFLLIVFYIFQLVVIGNCQNHIDTIFKLPSLLPTWPPGGGFATGEIDLGGLRIRQISTFQKISSVNEGGPDNVGATFFEPSSIPDGFSMLGSYAQPNNQPLFGWVLVGKTNARDGSGDILKRPIGYTLVATTPRNTAYFWLPTPPDNYNPVGLVVTASPDKPSLDRIRCVRSDFTDVAEPDKWIWGENGLNVFGLKPKIRGANAQPLSVGTFTVQTGGGAPPLLSCLKNKNPNFTNTTPNFNQIAALFQTYSPIIYFHPDEKYLPSSVNWFFANGALLYTKGQERNPVTIQPNGSNLPLGGWNDGLYWMDINGRAKSNVAKGDLGTAEVYLHVKSILGGTFSEIQVWVFYPFNGPAAAKVGPVDRVQLGKIGEHVGDWEHVTLRISNFDGTLTKVFFAAHARGKWVDSSSLEFQNGNHFVVYASLNGHASYPRAGLVMLGGQKDAGIRDDTSRKGVAMDTGGRFTVVAADGPQSVVAPPWLDYNREWGPNLSYDFWNDVKKVKKFLMIGSLKRKFQSLIDSLPKEVVGEEGPTGPKMKGCWLGEENDN